MCKKKEEYSQALSCHSFEEKAFIAYLKDML